MMKKAKKISVLIFSALVLTLLIACALVIFAEPAVTRRGDVNGDKAVDSSDIVLLRQYLAGYDYDENVPPFEVGSGADLNDDGKITSVDVIMLRQYLVEYNDFTEVVESDGGAIVFAKSGVEYTAQGYKAVKNNKFVFNQGLQIDLGESFASEFNRITFDYEVTEPIKLYVTYTLDGEEKTDYFFLEAAKHSFRGLIEGYLANKQGIELKKLTVDTCEEVDAEFILHGISTEVIPLYKDDLCVENDRYKIGCRLSWGGAMTYFEDKQDGDDTLGNLVNIHDTGRLIQQSFYGTYSNGEYVSDVNPSGVTWPYNPVQGGDKKNNGSTRLVDVEVGEDYIYILTQPLDWAKPLYVTPLYYENTYTLMEDHVVVNNVATDFSGWEHIAGGQEIPAVYLVSYFDTLSFYNGSKPWTGDLEGVHYESELQGWSNAGSFPLYRGNTETWSIWINTEDGFGFGTYCPNIQRHIAIRHQYNGSKDPMNNSTSYVAPSCSIVMQTYVPIEYSYILATGDPEDIRRVFEENKDFTDNASLSENRYDQLISPERYDMMNMDFSSPENVDIFCGLRHVSLSHDADEGALKIYVENGRDPYAALNFDWNSDKTITSLDFNTIEIEYMLPETNSKATDSLVLFLCAGEVSSYNESNTVKGVIKRDGEYHTLTIRVPEEKCYGEMHKLRFDVFTSAAIGDVMYVKSIKLKKIDYPDLTVDNDLTVKGAESLASTLNYTQTYFDTDEGAVALKSFGGKDVGAYFDFSCLNLSTVQYKTLEIEYMIPVTNNAKSVYSSVYFNTSDYSTIDGSQVVSSSDVKVDGQYHTMTFDFTKKAEYWTGDILGFRFDYFQNTPAEGDVMYIKRIRFVSVEGYEVELEADASGKYFAEVSGTDVYFDEAKSALVLKKTGGSDVWVKKVLSDKGISTEEYSKILIRYMIPKTNSREQYSTAIYFDTSTHPGFEEPRSVYGTLYADGAYHTAIFDFSSKSDWSGELTNIRFDYFQDSNSAVGDLVYVESIILIK